MIWRGRHAARQVRRETAVVAFGGGHGLAQGLLAVQDYADVITAVVSVVILAGSPMNDAPMASR